MPPHTEKAKSIKRRLKFIIFAVDSKKTFNGIIGQIDLYSIKLLLQGGTRILEEECSSSQDPVVWYSNLLLQQDIIIKKGFEDKNNTVWLQVDVEKTPIEEFALWNEVDPSSEDLAWRTYWIPCTADTKTECLGFWVSAKESFLSNKLSIATILKKCLEVA